MPDPKGYTLSKEAVKATADTVHWFQNNSQLWTLNGSQPGGASVPYFYLIPVPLTQDGGSDGNRTSTPNYTYTAIHPTDSTITLGTDLTPQFQRAKGSFKVATFGMGYFTVDNYGSAVFVLLQCDEVPNTGNGC